MNRISLTSSVVAMARALYAGAPPPYAASDDPCAEQLVPRMMATIVRGMRPLWSQPRAMHALLQVGTFGLFEHVALRSRAIDDAIAHAVAAGARQLVILGAGLDARAFRLPAARALAVFEVDHPKTQAYKQLKTRGLVARARSHRFVAVDFEHPGDLGDKLVSAGFAPEQPTAWLMEGVSMYLPRSALEKTLADVRRIGASNGRLFITYQSPNVASMPVVGSVVRGTLALIGEPFRTFLSRRQMQALLTAHGMRVEADTGTVDWRRSYSPEVRAVLPWTIERLAVATY